jgi:hypothetical protein
LPKKLVSLKGTDLHPELVNIVKLARENYETYINDSTNCTLKPVFITYKDEENYNDVSKWTINTIDAAILSKLEDF